MHDDKNDEGPVIEVPLDQVEDVRCEALFGQIEEIDVKEAEREEDHDEEAHHLFAYEESKLELKDERSS